MLLRIVIAFFCWVFIALAGSSGLSIYWSSSTHAQVEVVYLGVGATVFLAIVLLKGK